MDSPLDNATLNRLYAEHFENPDVCFCGNDQVRVELLNGVSLFYIFADGQSNKSLYRESRERFNRSVFDVIVFNEGNGPPYDFEEKLEGDLSAMQHTEKPVILLRTWWERYFRYLDDQNKIGNLTAKHPNLLYVNAARKYSKYQSEDTEAFIALKEGGSKYWGHFAQPGVPEHYAMDILHLIDVVTTVQQHPLNRAEAEEQREH